MKLTVHYHDGDSVSETYINLDALMRTIEFVSQCTLTVKSLTVDL